MLWGGVIDTLLAGSAGLFAGRLWGRGVEVKLATNQLTLFVWIVSVAAYLIGWLLQQTGIMQS